jgi:hypothetical protein
MESPEMPKGKGRVNVKLAEAGQNTPLRGGVARRGK